jgi:hypothetical protein
MYSDPVSSELGRAIVTVNSKLHKPENGKAATDPLTPVSILRATSIISLHGSASAADVT